MQDADWYFDFVSPFSYFAWRRLGELPADLRIAYRPILFAALLKHWGQKGPAEIASKRIWTYRWCTWWAAEHSIPFRMPSAHPFNPLPYLRLAIAANGTREAIDFIFNALWTTGADPSDEDVLGELITRLGIDRARLSAEEVKTALRRETDAALDRKIFGVPTLVIDDELFWGAEALEFVKAYVADRSIIRSAEMKRVATLPIGAARRAQGSRRPTATR